MAPDHLDAPGPDDDTVVRPAVMPSRPGPADPDLDDTVLSGHGLDALRSTPRRASDETTPRSGAVPPSPAPPLPSPEPPPTPPAQVRLPDGSIADVAGGPVYVGRRPTLPRVTEAGVPQLVTVPSPGREVSSTHLSISAVGGAVVVRDMLSTNGTVIKTPGVPARTLLRGETAVVTPGTTLDLGDGNVIEVLR